MRHMKLVQENFKPESTNDNKDDYVTLKLILGKDNIDDEDMIQVKEEVNEEF